MEVEAFVHHLNNEHPTIKFTSEISTNTVNFLDVTITEDHLETGLYRKPTDTFKYLHYKSFQPGHQKKSIPYTQFVRVRRICSNKKNFYTHTNLMIAHMHQRGYPINLLLQAQTKAAQLERDKLVDPVKTTTIQNKIPLIVTFDPAHKYISNGVKASQFLVGQCDIPTIKYKTTGNLQA